MTVVSPLPAASAAAPVGIAGLISIRRLPATEWVELLAELSGSLEELVVDEQSHVGGEVECVEFAPFDDLIAVHRKDGEAILIPAPRRLWEIRGEDDRTTLVVECAGGSTARLTLATMQRPRRRPPQTG